MKQKTTPKTEGKPKAARPVVPSSDDLRGPDLSYPPSDIRAGSCDSLADKKEHEFAYQAIMAACASNDEVAIRFLHRLRSSLGEAVANMVKEFDEGTRMVLLLRQCGHVKYVPTYRDLALRLDQVTAYLNEL